MTPHLSVQETYTDNLRLAPPGQEESDWITEVSPGVSVSTRGARLQLQADYAFQYRAYARNSEDNTHNHSLASNALWDVWNKELFLQAAASASQTTVSTLGGQPQGNANVTDNRTEYRQATVSPYWVRGLGNWGKLDARYTWIRSEASGDFSLYNSESSTVSVGLTNGPAFGNFGWGLNYRLSHSRSSGGAFENRQAESFLASLRYQILPTFAFTGTIGREDNDYPDVTGSDVSGTNWSVGGDWAPSTRTRVTASYGERYFGNTYKLNASHRTRLTTWSLGYSQDVNDAPSIVAIPISASTVATVDSLFLSRIPDPRERQLAVQTFIQQNGLPLSLSSPVQFLANQVTLVKRWQGGFGILGVRSSLLVSVYSEERSNLSQGIVNGPFNPFAISDVVDQTGISSSLSWRFSNRTAASSSLGYSRSRYPDAGRVDTGKFVNLTLSHQIQPKIFGSINARVVTQDSDAAGGDYREHAIVGTLRMTF